MIMANVLSWITMLTERMMTKGEKEDVNRVKKEILMFLSDTCLQGKVMFKIVHRTYLLFVFNEVAS